MRNMFDRACHDSRHNLLSTIEDLSTTYPTYVPATMLLVWMRLGLHALMKTLGADGVVKYQSRNGIAHV